MDIERLVDAVTKEIMCRLDGMQKGGNNICCVDCNPLALFSSEANILGTGNIANSDYVVLPRAEYEQLKGCKPSAESLTTTGGSYASSNCFDFSNKKLLHESDVRNSGAVCGDTIGVGKNTIITALAADYAKSNNIKIVKG